MMTITYANDSVKHVNLTTSLGKNLVKGLKKTTYSKVDLVYKSDNQPLAFWGTAKTSLVVSLGLITVNPNCELPSQSAALE